MSGLSCNSCNKEFADDSEQKLHYKSEWHRYNLKRKVAGVPGVTEALFLARQSALAEEKSKSQQSPMLYTCGLCCKGYRSSKAHAQHLKSKAHITRVSQGLNHPNDENVIIKPLLPNANKGSKQREQEDEESDGSDEWVEVDSDEDLGDEATDMVSDLNGKDEAADGDMDEDELELDPSSCFMCDLEHDTTESCIVHLHKHHGFFVPDVEYLKDPKGLLTYLGLKVKRDFICLYCDERRQPFNSLEAVRKHMEAKSHCKVHYGDGGDDEEVELDEFYDYSSSYVGTDGNQMVATEEGNNDIELGSGGSELVITRRSDDGTSTKRIGSREYLRYYRQKPRPSSMYDTAISAALAARYRSLGLATVQSKEHLVRIKVLKEMNRSGVEMMRSKMGMKSNVIRKLPNNVPY